MTWEGDIAYLYRHILIKVIRLKFKRYYSNGKLEGEYLEYDEQGNLRGKGFYRNGKLMAKGIYSKGKKVGIWEHRYKDGTLMKTVNWKNGKNPK